MCMYQNAQAKHLFLVFGFCLFVFSPLLVVIVPAMVPMTVFFEKYTWVYYTPTVNHIFYGVGIFVLICICVLLLATDLKKWAVRTSIGLAVVALFIFIAGSSSYMKMSQQGIQIRTVFQVKEQLYDWSDIARAEYFENRPERKGGAYYEVHFKDGEMYSFRETKHVLDARSKMKFMLDQNKIKLEQYDYGNS